MRRHGKAILRSFGARGVQGPFSPHPEEARGVCAADRWMSGDRLGDGRRPKRLFDHCELRLNRRQESATLMLSGQLALRSQTRGERRRWGSRCSLCMSMAPFGLDIRSSCHTSPHFYGANVSRSDLAGSTPHQRTSPLHAFDVAGTSLVAPAYSEIN